MNIVSRKILFLILGLTLLSGNAWAQDTGLPSLRLLDGPSPSAERNILLAATLCTLRQSVSSGCGLHARGRDPTTRAP